MWLSDWVVNSVRVVWVTKANQPEILGWSKRFPWLDLTQFVWTPVAQFRVTMSIVNLNIIIWTVTQISWLNYIPTMMN